MPSGARLGEAKAKKVVVSLLAAWPSASPAIAFISQQPQLSYGIYAAHMLAICWVFVPIAIRVTSVRLPVPAPIVMVLCVLGAHALAIMADNDPRLVFTRPISRGLLLAAALSVVLAIWQHLRPQKRALEQDRLSKARSIEGIARRLRGLAGMKHSPPHGR